MIHILGQSILKKMRRKTMLMVVAMLLLVATGTATANEVNQLHNKDSNIGGALYPRATTTRDVRTLDGVWNFRKSPDPDYGFKNGWFKQDLDKTGPVIPMPVPSSFNDVGDDGSLRDHVGLVWYDRRFHVPRSWVRDEQRIWLRFSSAHYAAQVWVNGKKVMSHEIGHLPFEVEINDVISADKSNLLTVALDNRLQKDTIPQGTVNTHHYGNKTVLTQSYNFDFFNYAGIHRTVFLYSTPRIYIDDIIIRTKIQGLTGIVEYDVKYKGSSENEQCHIQLIDKNEVQVATSQVCSGQMKINNAHFWWPHLMHHDPGYLYTFKASILGKKGDTIDTYSEKIGIRTVKWTNTSIYLNDKPIYFQGFAMHEDSDIHGRGWDPVLWVRNFYMIKWLGANAFRTSHYPYAEEIFQMADEHGIMIIDECPSTDTDSFSEALLANHKQALTETIRRDKNHPSVIMWSIANEPHNTGQKKAEAYFEQVVQHVKSMDLSRPVTSAIAVSYWDDKLAKLLDVICINRYFSWYPDTGNLLVTAKDMEDDAKGWFKKNNKPVAVTEYGAGTLAGLHSAPEIIWSEEYQVALMSEYFKAFDKLRQAGFFVGEFIWNFADTETAQRTDRPAGNKKGILTRNRQPKSSAHHLRARYLSLAAADSGSPPPAPAYYVSDNKPTYHEDF